MPPQTIMQFPYWVPLISLIVGLVGGMVGAYLSMRVGLAVLESRMERAERDIDSMSNQVREDLKGLGEKFSEMSGAFTAQVAEIIGKIEGYRDGNRDRHYDRDDHRTGRER